MDKIKTIRALLSNIGMPQKQQTDICVLTILAMANLKKRTKWFEATNEWLRIHDIIEFVNKNIMSAMLKIRARLLENKHYIISVMLHL